MANVFYVYEHWRPDLDVPFYVGKGKGKRACKMKERGSHHRNIVNKLAKLGMCVEVRLVAHSLTEQDAFDLEVKRIAEWRSIGVLLCNKTNGGDGVSGLVMGKNARAKMSLAKIGRLGIKTMLGRKHKPETIEKMSLAKKGKKPNNFGKKCKKRPPISEETRLKMSAAKKGKKLTEEHRAAVSAKIKAWWDAKKVVTA